jgi:hypothetical protein
MLPHVIALLVMALGGAALLAATASNPYREIVARNVFALKAPSSSSEAETIKRAPPPLILTGIVTFGVKRALMTKPSTPSRSSVQTAPQSFIVAEGQRDGGVEVVEINERLGAVKVIYEGTPITLHFEANGSTLSRLRLPKNKHRSPPPRHLPRQVGAQSQPTG